MLHRPVSLFVGLRYTMARRGSPLVSFLGRVAMLGLILGVCLLTLVMSVMNGFDRELRDRILALVPHATINAVGPMHDWREVIRIAGKDPDVLGAAPYVRLQGMLVRGAKVKGVLLYAVDPARQGAVSEIRRFFDSGDLAALAKAPGGVLISKTFADELGAGTGDTLALVLPAESSQLAGSGVRLARLTVAGVFDTGTEIDQKLAFIGLAEGQKLAGLGDAVGGVQLRVDDLMKAWVVSQRLLEKLPQGLYARDWTSTHGNLFQAIHLSKQMVSLLLLIVIAVAAFNVVSTLMMAVLDKRGDIAILQTLGMTPADIARVFVFHGTAIGVIGTAIGALAGYVLSLYVTDIVQWLQGVLHYQFLKSDVYPVAFLPSDPRWGDFAAVCATAVVLSFLASLYPALRAARVQPAAALRYDA